MPIYLYIALFTWLLRLLQWIFPHIIISLRRAGDFPTRRQVTSWYDCGRSSSLLSKLRLLLLCYLLFYKLTFGQESETYIKLDFPCVMKKDSVKRLCRVLIPTYLLLGVAWWVYRRMWLLVYGAVAGLQTNVDVSDTFIPPTIDPVWSTMYCCGGWWSWYCGCPW